MLKPPTRAGSGSGASGRPLVPLLLSFAFWLPRAEAGLTAGGPADAATLRRAIGAHLRALGWPGAEPLRWAITAVDPLQGLRLEGVALGAGAAGAAAQ